MPARAEGVKYIIRKNYLSGTFNKSLLDHFVGSNEQRLRQQRKRSVVARRADTWVQVPRTDTLNC
jgi:hypothetical protein